MNPQSILDIECYSNFFLVCFMRTPDDKIKSFECRDGKALDFKSCEAIKDIIKRHELITFNGNSYDIPLLRLALTGATTDALKSASDDIINNKVTAWQFEKKYKLPSTINVNTIDLKEVAPGSGSLKIYGGRLHCEKMQDLPIEPHEILTPEQMHQIKVYCGNDLRVTKKLFEALSQQIQLRRNMSQQYKIDLRSKSDAQIAEDVIKAEITRATGRRPVKMPVVAREFRYQIPDFIHFTNPVLLNAVDIVTRHPFRVTQTGVIEMPRELLTLKIQIGSSIYQMGMGGLHSTESKCFHVSDEDYLLVSPDVSSYYPAIILNCGLFPSHLGEVFTKVYREIVTERLAAKATGDKVKADSLKITINGSFGKMGSPYSVLYAPELMVQVTVTGQLSLLMLIDMLESSGIPVVSANTDGIVIKCPVAKEKLMNGIIEEWERLTNFTMEQTLYSGVYSRDVNSYVAIKYDGKATTKGHFAFGGLSKNPTNEICNIAVVAYLKDGVPFADSVKACKDITKFLTIRTVDGGAVKGADFLGKTVRFYYTKGEKGTINYKRNNHVVPRTQGAKPCMDLPAEFPGDVDHEWYIKECWSMLGQVGLDPKGPLSLW